MLPMDRYRCDISSRGAVLPGRNDAEMDPANSLHASAYYSEYTERFDLISGKGIFCFAQIGRKKAMNFWQRTFSVYSYI